MDFWQSPPANDQRSEDSEDNEVTIAPKEVPTGEESRSIGLAHDRDAIRDSSNKTHDSMPRGGFDFSAVRAPSSVRVSPGLRGINKPLIDRPSVGRRILRSCTRYLIAVLIGVGATLAWQSHADEAKETVRAWAPSLAWLLPLSKPKPSDAPT